MFSFSYHDMKLITIVIVLIILLIFVFVLGLLSKRWLVKNGWARDEEGSGTLEGALLSLFAIFLAFSFSMATDRFNNRRDSIITEANAIGTAALRADLYPDSIRIPLRKEFKQYLEYRIAYYEAGDDDKKIADAINNSDQSGKNIWRLVTSHSADPHFYEPTRLMVPSLNEMLDAATSRDAALHAQVPESIIWVLLLLGLCSGFIVGYGSRTANVNFIGGTLFVIMISVALTLIIDLDRPRRGLITNKKAHDKILGLRELF